MFKGLALTTFTPIVVGHDRGARARPAKSTGDLGKMVDGFSLVFMSFACNRQDSCAVLESQPTN